MNYIYDYTLIDKSFFEDWSLKSMVICGFLFCLIFIPTYLNAYKIAAEKFKKLYPNDEIIYIVKNGIVFMFVFTFCIGGYFGGDILPLLVFKNIPQQYIPFNNIIIAFIVSVGSIYAMLERLNLIYVLSNKRIQLIRALYSVKFNEKIDDIKYKNIKSVNYAKFLTWEQLNITLKKGNVFNGLIAFKNLKYVKELVEENIEKEQIYD